MSFTLTDDPQFSGLEMSLSNIFMIGLFRSKNSMVVFCKTEKRFISQQTRRGPYIYDVHMEWGWGSLKICRISADSFVFKQKIYYSFLQIEGVGGCHKINHFFVAIINA